MATVSITTLSSNKTWVLACDKYEKCEIESLLGDVSFIESEEIPTTLVEENNMWFKEFIPREFIGDGKYNLWIFIDKLNKVRKRPYSKLSNVDSLGNKSHNTIIGENVTAQRVSQINVMFQHNISPYDVLTEISGTGTLSQLNAKAQLNTGLGIGKAVIISKDSLTYFTGHQIGFEKTMVFAEPQLNTNQKMGMGNESDTFAGFGYKDLEFGIWLQLVDSPITFIPQSEFNRDNLTGLSGSKYSINPDKFNIYKVTLGWYGILPIDFHVFDPSSRDYIKVHSYDGINKSTNPHLADASQPLISIIERLSGTGANMTMQTSSWWGGIYGLVPNNRAIRNFLIKTTKSTTDNTPIISIRNKTTFKGIKNNIQVRIGTFTVVSDGAQSVELDIYKDGILTGGVWNEVDADSSVIEYNNTATAFTPTGNVVGGTGISKVDSDRINLFGNDVVLSVLPGEEYHVIASGNNNVILYLRNIERG